MSQLVTSLLLLAPGVLSAAGYLWLGTGHTFGVPSKDATAFLLLVPWQLLGLTIAKYGMDAWVLARAQAVPGFHVVLRKLAATRVVPAAVLYGLLLGLRFPLWTSAALAISVAVDAMAVVLAAEIAGRGKVKTVAVAHLFRLPLFFSLALCGSLLTHISLSSLLATMCLTAVVRFIALTWWREKGAASPDALPGAGSLAMQQLFNYGLFKNDQLAFSLLPASIAGIYQASFVFCVRFPELVSAAINALGPQLYPHIIGDRIQHALFSTKYRVCAVTLFWAMCYLLAAAAFGLLSPVNLSDRFLMLAAIGIHGALILPTNVSTYRLMRSNDLRGLNVSSFAGNAVGVALIASALVGGFDRPNLFLWIIPAQQMVFLYLSRERRKHAGSTDGKRPK